MPSTEIHYTNMIDVNRDAEQITFVDSYIIESETLEDSIDDVVQDGINRKEMHVGQDVKNLHFSMGK